MSTTLISLVKGAGELLGIVKPEVLQSEPVASAIEQFSRDALKLVSKPKPETPTEVKDSTEEKLNPKEELSAAVKSRDVEKVKKLVMQGTDMNTDDSGNDSAYMRALAIGNLELAQAMHSNPENKPNLFQSPAITLEGEIDPKTLPAYQIFTDGKESDQFNSKFLEFLHEAHPNLLKDVIEAWNSYDDSTRKELLEKTPELSRSLFKIAFKEKDLKQVKELISQGVDMNFLPKGEGKESIYMQVVKTGDLKTLKLMHSNPSNKPDTLKSAKNDSTGARSEEEKDLPAYQIFAREKESPGFVLGLLKHLVENDKDSAEEIFKAWSKLSKASQNELQQGLPEVQHGEKKVSSLYKSLLSIKDLLTRKNAIKA